ncbi:MAG: histidinol-phosphatase HisJ family protein [Oscillospiraceae bacterium]|nr:histidinol-phosphatase HisJ family protein [Oscillospiraceae bacterium]
MNIIDTHVHSNFSFDGDNSPREIIERALEMGLTALTFTDHIDLNGYHSNTEYNQAPLMAKALLEIPPLIEEYRDRISLGFGVEMGQIVQYPALANQLIAEFNFDYVIGSVHEVRGHKDFFCLDYTALDVPKLMGQYFAEVLETVQTADIDVIGHLTYPLRYITGDYKIYVNLDDYTDIIQEIFKAAIQRGIGLEINTSGLRKAGYTRTFPDLSLVKRFRNLGGEILTIGSDAHRISDLAAGYAEAAEIARGAGFAELAYFEGRRAKFTVID